jgi:tetratricopeptide (TPR) repeat protein
LATASEAGAAHREALKVLEEARDLVGASPVLNLLGEQHRRALGETDKNQHAGTSRGAQTAWEHYALGRSWLRSGDFERALTELREAVALEPQGCWPNYYFGLCASRLNHWEDAALAFSVCIGAAPELAGLYFNRAVALEKTHRDLVALGDYGRALELDPTMAAAALNRGMLQFRLKRYGEARSDLQTAARLGADPATVHYDMALIDLAQGDRESAAANLRRALDRAPAHPEALALLAKLEKQKRR